jgi:hypothetical protein
VAIDPKQSIIIKMAGLIIAVSAKSAWQEVLIMGYPAGIEQDID